MSSYGGASGILSGGMGMGMGGSMFGGGGGSGGGSGMKLGPNFLTNMLGLTSPNAPQVPQPTKVGKDYMGLLAAQIQSQPTIFNTEQQWKPQYLGLNQSLLPGAAQAIGDANPGQAGLLSRLTQQASEGLDAGANLGPLQPLALNSLRGGQAARGLGYGPGDALNESMGVAQFGNQLQQQRQGFASGVAGMQNQFVTQPALGMVTQGGTPTVVPSSQSYDMFNTAYNARAAANIAGANNAAAAQSY